MRPNLPRPMRGSALILVLWCLLLLGMAVLGVIGLVELSVSHTAHGERTLTARSFALSGLALGLHPQILKNDPILTQKDPVRGDFKVTIGSEGARLNPNYVLLSGHREILTTLFTRWGLKIEEADRVVDCLHDWITPGDLRSLNGAKAIDYARAGLPQRPSSQPFVSFSEMSQVMGMAELIKARPNWQDCFTLWSQGPLNVSEAPADLIAAVFNLDEKRVNFFIEARNGKDGIAGTEDDFKVSDREKFQEMLGLDELTMKALGEQISFNDTIRRVESIGQARGEQVMISVVTRLNTSPIQYLLWSEQ